MIGEMISLFVLSFMTSKTHCVVSHKASHHTHRSDHWSPTRTSSLSLSNRLLEVPDSEREQFIVRLQAKAAMHIDQSPEDTTILPTTQRTYHQLGHPKFWLILIIHGSKSMSKLIGHYSLRLAVASFTKLPNPRRFCKIPWLPVSKICTHMQGSA
jgi:hypothetical protein